MKRTLFALLFVLACVVTASAQEAEFSSSGGTAGAITAAPGSGTAGRVPQFASTTSLEDSKMTTSGTNSGTWTLYDPTLVNGETKLVLRAGVAQSTSAPIFEVLDAAGDSLSGGDGVMQFVSGQAGVGARFYEVTSSAQDWSLGPNIFSMKSTYELRWSDGAFFYGSIDTGLARSAAGILAVTDGSTGQGGIGIADAAINSVSDALILRHATSGTAAASFGTGLLFQGEDGAGNMQDMASIDAVYTDASNGSEDSSLVFSGITAGAVGTIATLKANDLVFTGNANIEADNLLLSANAGDTYVQATGAIRFGTIGVAGRWIIDGTSGYFAPQATNTYDIGTSSAFVRNNYVSTSIQGATSVTLTAATDDPFVEIAVPVGGTVGGYVEYTIVADDATDYQSRSGILPFTVVNKGGTESAAIGTPGAATEAFAESAGGSTLTNTFTTDNATGSNNVRIRANVVSSLTETTLAIKCRVVITSGTATLTFNP